MFLAAATSNLRVLGGILIRDASYRGAKPLVFGFLADIIEPLMIVAVICFFRWALADQAKYGTDVVLFIGTGVFPSWLWVRTCLYVAKPVSSEHPMFPVESQLDHIVIHGLLHLINSSLGAIGFFTVLYYCGEKDALPADVWMAIVSMAVLFFFGLGVGLINSVLGRFIPVWAGIWAAIARGLMHFCAIFMVPDYLNPPVRQLFWYNPVLHGVSWFRHAFYPTYPNVINDHGYILAFMLITLPIGLLAVRVLEKQVEGDESEGEDS